MLAQSAPPAPPALTMDVPPPAHVRPVAAQAKMNLGLPIAVGLGAAALSYMLWRKR